MSRWIDADIIAQQMRELPHEYSNKEQRARTGGIACCQEIVREAPSIDIVRCRECKHYNGKYCFNGNATAPKAPNDDDFCSWGERSSE